MPKIYSKQWHQDPQWSGLVFSSAHVGEYTFASGETVLGRFYAYPGIHSCPATGHEAIRSRKQTYPGSRVATILLMWFVDAALLFFAGLIGPATVDGGDNRPRNCVVPDVVLAHPARIIAHRARWAVVCRETPRGKAATGRRRRAAHFGDARPPSTRRVRYRCLRGRSASASCRQMATKLYPVRRHDYAIIPTSQRTANRCGAERRTDGGNTDELGRPRDRDGARRPGRASGHHRSNLRRRAVGLELSGRVADARQAAISSVARSNAAAFTFDGR